MGRKRKYPTVEAALEAKRAATRRWKAQQKACGLLTVATTVEEFRADFEQLGTAAIFIPDNACPLKPTGDIPMADTAVEETEESK